jgi:NAD(P)-dependent dehydrogenase (short-subunit alcohol dehydrogenase family)
VSIAIVNSIERLAMGDLLAGRSALVTGGARGIGRAIVGQFAAHGARGIVLDLEAVLATATLPPGFAAQAADVTREGEIAAAFAAAGTAFGRLDIVVANAGIVPRWRETAGLDLEEWNRVFAVNARGIALTLKHAVPVMKEAGGSIILTASINVAKGAPRQLAYTASKHAVLGIARCAALDLGRHNIRVNALAPGPVLSEALRERIRYRQNLGGPSEAQSEIELARQTPLAGSRPRRISARVPSSWLPIFQTPSPVTCCPSTGASASPDAPGHGDVWYHPQLPIEAAR